MRQILIASIIALSATLPLGAVTLTIDPSIRHQTIDGFGGFGGIIAEYSDGAQYSDAWVNLIVNDLGLSIHRYFLNPNDLEPTNDNSSPFVTDLTRFNTAGRLGTQIPLLSRLKSAGVEKFFFSILSPPYWMKEGPFYTGCYGGGDCSCCGGSLRTDMYDEFAEFCAAYIKLTRQHTGIDLYALSVQNEPRFPEPYPACVYAAPQLRDVVKKVGARLASEGLSSTKLMIAEDLLSTFGTLEGACMADTAARPYIGVFGTHTYSDGINPTQNSQSATLWAAAKRKAGPSGVPLWMTETSGYDNSFSGALTMVQGIYAALRYGNAAGWIYYRLGGSNDALTLNGQPTWLYYGCKQFFRYIRPGAMRIECASDDTTVLALAFTHTNERTLTLVFVNQSSSEKQTTLPVFGSTSLNAYRTSALERCAAVTVLNGTTLTLAPNSITTLYGTGYETPATAGTRPPAVSPGRSTLCALPRSVRVCDIRGRTTQSTRASGVTVSFEAKKTAGVTRVLFVR